MCNRYRPASPGEISEVFSVPAPAEPYKPGLGPRGDGPFVRPSGDALQSYVGQWALIGDRDKQRKSVKMTNNARLESLHTRSTFADPWKRGQRCLIPARAYVEPYWFLDPDGNPVRSTWWSLERKDGQVWALAGIWNDWTDPATGEIVPSYTMVTRNCDGHPLLSRLHKPNPKLPADKQNKRAVIPLEVQAWDAWLHGSVDEAVAVLELPPIEFYDTAGLEGFKAETQASQGIFGHRAEVEH